MARLPLAVIPLILLSLFALSSRDPVMLRGDQPSGVHG
jgi:hypothetical protein